MIDSLCIIGHPSPLGGADTELDHQIHCWQAMGIEVHLCPTGPLDDNLKAMKMEERGCIYHRPKDWPSLDGLHCISFCNDGWLGSERSEAPRKIDSGYSIEWLASAVKVEIA